LTIEEWESDFEQEQRFSLFFAALRQNLEPTQWKRKSSMNFIPNHLQDTVVTLGKIVFFGGWIHPAWNNHSSLPKKISVFHCSEPKTECLRTPEHETFGFMKFWKMLE
jgi:hypothetical protein